MKRTLKTLTIVIMMAGVAATVYADRGNGRKARTKTNLNISTANTLKKSIALNINSGLNYRGSLLYRSAKPASGYMQNLITYQKGNTTYILPYRHKFVMPDMRTGGIRISLRK